MSLHLLARQVCLGGGVFTGAPSDLCVLIFTRMGIRYPEVILITVTQHASPYPLLARKSSLVSELCSLLSRESYKPTSLSLYLPASVHTPERQERDRGKGCVASYIRYPMYSCCPWRLTVETHRHRIGCCFFIDNGEMCSSLGRHFYM